MSVTNDVADLRSTITLLDEKIDGVQAELDSRTANGEVILKDLLSRHSKALKRLSKLEKRFDDLRENLNDVVKITNHNTLSNLKYNKHVKRQWKRAHQRIREVQDMFLSDITSLADADTATNVRVDTIMSKLNWAEEVEKTEGK